MSDKDRIILASSLESLAEKSPQILVHRRARPVGRSKIPVQPVTKRSLRDSQRSESTNLIFLARRTPQIKIRRVSSRRANLSTARTVTLSRKKVRLPNGRSGRGNEHKSWPRPILAAVSSLPPPLHVISFSFLSFFFFSSPFSHRGLRASREHISRYPHSADSRHSTGALKLDRTLSTRAAKFTRGERAISI